MVGLVVHDDLSAGLGATLMITLELAFPESIARPPLSIEA